MTDAVASRLSVALADRYVLDHELDRRSDVYALACLTYEKLAGDPPFVASNPAALIARHMVDTPPPITTVRRNVSEATAAALARALSKAPGWGEFPLRAAVAQHWSVLSSGVTVLRPQTEDPMAPIGRYHVLDFGTARRATEAAGALIEFLGTPGGLKHGTGLRRAVIWGEGQDAPPAVQGLLYISDGALDAARERKLDFPSGQVIPADQLPGTAKLLHGHPQ